MDRKHATWRRWRGRPLRVPRILRVGGTRRRLLTILVLAIAALGLLPLLVAKTSLRDTVFSAAIPGDDLIVTVGDASLSWFSTPSLARLEVKDTAGNLLLTAERISIDRTPWKLLANRHDIGLIEIVRPT